MSSRALSTLTAGQRGRIQAIVADDAVRHRMQAMGLRAGREAFVVRASRLGGPIQVRVGSISLILRRADAAMVEIALAG